MGDNMQCKTEVSMYKTIRWKYIGDTEIDDDIQKRLRPFPKEITKSMFPSENERWRNREGEEREREREREREEETEQLHSINSSKKEMEQLLLLLFSILRRQTN